MQIACQSLIDRFYGENVGTSLMLGFQWLATLRDCSLDEKDTSFLAEGKRRGLGAWAKNVLSL